MDEALAAGSVTMELFGALLNVDMASATRR